MSKITFEIDGKDYHIPEYLTIGDYVKIYKVKDLFSEDYFQAKLINIVTGAPVDVLMKSEKGKVISLSELIIDLIPFKKPMFESRFVLDKVEYGFIPDWKKLSFAEFADLDTLMTKKPEEILDYIHIITAILYRPITKSKSFTKYEIEEYDYFKTNERAELFKNKLNIEVYLGSQFFFTLFVRNYLNRTQISSTNLNLIEQIKLMWIMLKIWRMTKLNSRKHLDGLWWSIELHKMISQNTKSFLKRK